MQVRVRYFNTNKLLEAIQMSRIEAKAAKFFDRRAEVDLLSMISSQNTPVADAVLDRLAKTAHRIKLSGDSMRK